MNVILNISLPLKDPVLIFTIVIFIVLISPIFLKKLNMPDIIGLIIAGIIIGPKGLNLLTGDIGLSIFGTIGLMYLMFLAGLEIDLNDFIKNRKQGAWFGILTFIIPFVVGFIVFRYFLSHDLRATLLISIMLSSHTLVSYPIVGRLGITGHSIITVAIAGTIIADTAVLIILGLISDSVKGDLSFVFWLKAIANFGIFAIYIIKILPLVSKWFFKNQESEGGIQYVFVFTAMFVSASLAEFLSIEPLIGAFFAGLSLNRLIIRTSSLMNRIVFIGNTLFIPFFIISIGMRVDLSVLFQSLNSFIILIVLLTIAFGSKYLAAISSSKIFGYGKNETNLLFGLSTSRAASTIAIIIIGYNFKLIDEVILNNTVLLILFTSLVSSMVTQRAGEKVAKSSNEKSNKDDEYPERILVPVSNPSTIQKLLEFSLVIKDPDSNEPVFPITVVKDGNEASEKNELNKKMMSKTLEHSVATGGKFEPITRIDLNVVDGMLRSIKELMITKIIIGWHGKATALDIIFGTILDKLLYKTDKMVFVAKMTNPMELINEIKIILPKNIEKEKGHLLLLKSLKNISKHLNKKMTFFGTSGQMAEIENIFQSKKLTISVNTVAAKVDNSFFDDFSNKVSNNDLIVFVCSRKNTVSYHKLLDGFPRIINKSFQDNNILLVYPEQTIYKSGIFNIYDFNR